MQLVKAITIHLFVNLIPLVLIYLIFSEPLRFVLIFIYLLFYLLVYLWADKLILVFLGAREIIDADNKILFQAIKGKCFSNFLTMPKVYLYSGSRQKCFVLDSGKNWCLALDRELIDRATEEELGALIEYLLKLKISGLTKLQTKGMGVVAAILNLNYWILENVFFIKQGTKIYQVLCFLTLLFLKPIIELIFWISQINSSFECKHALRPLYYQSEQTKKIESFSEFMSLHLVNGVNYNELVVNYLESFPMFERCQFRDNHEI